MPSGPMNPPNAAADINGVAEPVEAQQSRTQDALVNLARLLGRQIARELNAAPPPLQSNGNPEIIKT